jgi:hypothetical protein
MKAWAIIVMKAQLILSIVAGIVLLATTRVGPVGGSG